MTPAATLILWFRDKLLRETIQPYRPKGMEIENSKKMALRLCSGMDVFFGDGRSYPMASVVEREGTYSTSCDLVIDMSLEMCWWGRVRIILVSSFL